jgi:hypothetical protein
METIEKTAKKTAISRRSFMKTVALSGVAMVPAASSLGDGGGISHGDAAILRFLAAAELLEADAWQQYNELAGGNLDYKEALEAIDDDMPDYVEQNTDDEFSHADFLNAYLESVNRKPVNLDAFRTLPSSAATGAAQTGRLTNLMHLNVDTSWYLRYRSEGNPDFGDTFPQVVNIVDRPGIPLHDGYSPNQIQAIANTAAFHFGMIEQGGSSLYDVMSLKATGLTVLRIITSIGGTEVAHFEIWNDTAGGIPPVDSGDGLVFTAPPDPEDVMPKPCKFISESLPLCSVIRPTSVRLAGAVAAVNFLTATGLFHGQSQAFFKFLTELAKEADSAMRRTDR